MDLSFPRNKVVSVSANIAKMIAVSRFSSFFEIIGDHRRHLGIFRGLMYEDPFESDAADNLSDGCC